LLNGEGRMMPEEPKLRSKLRMGWVIFVSEGEFSEYPESNLIPDFIGMLQIEGVSFLRPMGVMWRD
jgi:hypothetical protein|tara:strand:- start:5013 stop:5210 length:198 start_codon:yes stop_codon:yes gene_type:complete